MAWLQHDPCQPSCLQGVFLKVTLGSFFRRFLIFKGFHKQHPNFASSIRLLNLAINLAKINDGGPTFWKNEIRPTIKRDQPACLSIPQKRPYFLQKIAFLRIASGGALRFLITHVVNASKKNRTSLERERFFGFLIHPWKFNMLHLKNAPPGDPGDDPFRRPSISASMFNFGDVTHATLGKKKQRKRQTQLGATIAARAAVRTMTPPFSSPPTTWHVGATLIDVCPGWNKEKLLHFWWSQNIQ